MSASISTPTPTPTAVAVACSVCGNKQLANKMWDRWGKFFCGRDCHNSELKIQLELEEEREKKERERRVYIGESNGHGNAF